MSATDQQPTIEDFLAGFKRDLAKLLAEELREQMPAKHRLLTLAQVGEQLGISERGVRALVNGENPKLASLLIGEGARRVSQDDLDAYVESRRRAEVASRGGGQEDPRP